MINIMEKSRNIRIIKTFEEIKDEINFEDFDKKDLFVHICNLLPNKTLEKLEVQIIDNEKCKTGGLVYVFVIEGKIFKIGQSIDNIIKRVQSYNCGKVEYRIKGTNSTTNYFVLQSLLHINKCIEVYAFFPDLPEYTLFGKKYKDSWQVSKRAENIIINEFVEKYNKKPIGCTQK